MHITVITAGPRGATAPYAALALGLRAAGYGLRLVGAADFAPTARAYGLDYFALDAAPGPRALPDASDQLPAEAWHACQGTDAIVYDPFSMLNGYFLARQRGVPAVAAALAPFDATADHPAWPVYFGPRLGPTYNRLTHALAQQASWQAARGPVQKFWRQRAGYAPAEPFARQAAEEFPVLYGYSPRLLPRPTDWAAHLHVTGFWFLDPPDDWRPPAGLLAFLRAGPPPVLVDLPPASLPVAIEALDRAGLRGVLHDDGRLPAGLALPPTIIRVDNIPHAWLFPRLAAVLHPGDAATTAAGLRAGVPALVIPPSGQGAAWGRLLEARGLGAVARPGPTAARLAAQLQSLLADTALHDRLAAVSDGLSGEEGVQRAVAVIGEVVR